MKKIEFGELYINDLSKQHIQDCLDTNWITMGNKTREFETEWSSLFKYKHTIAFNSGTSADIAACMALYEMGAKPGQEVICPALSFIASGTAIRAAGFIPRFVDVDYDTLNINVDSMCDAINENTAAIMGVNLMGKPCAMDQIDSISRNANTPFIIDNCEAYGCQLNGKYSLHYADMETTSHFVAHIISMGEGGTVSTHLPHIKNILQSIRSHGREPHNQYFKHNIFGLNLRPTDLHASIGLGEVENFWRIFKRRKENLKYMRDAVKGFEDLAWFVEEDENCVNAPHAFSITLKHAYKDNIDKLTTGLDEAGIHHKRNFGSIPHHKAMSYLEYSKYSMPKARYIGDHGIHIGCHQYLSDEDLVYIGKTLQNILGKITT